MLENWWVRHKEGKVMQDLVGCMWAMLVGFCEDFGFYSE